jgi:hypothetical protein
MDRVAMTMKAVFPSLLAVAVLVGANQQVYGHGKKNRNINLVCVGQNVDCSEMSANVLNAVRDAYSWNTAGIAVEDLGPITQEKTVTVRFPQHRGQLKLYRFIPTMSTAFANKKITILFAIIDPKNLAPSVSGAVKKDAMMMQEKHADARLFLNVYRQVSGEKQWTQLAYIPMEDASILEAPFEVRIENNGYAYMDVIVQGQKKSQMIDLAEMY